MLALLAVLITAFAVGIGAWSVAVGSSVETPSLISLTREAAEAKAKEAGLDVRFADEVFDEVVPKGQVIRTDPEPGRKVAKSGTITAVLSAGPERYEVPDLKNVELAEARIRLADANFTVADTVAKKFSDDVPEGRVVSTDPPAGRELRRDTVVALTVSKGAKPVQLPDVVGKNVDEATSLLKSLGFEVDVTEQEDNEAASGEVLDMSPTGNRKVAKGSTIRLTVAKSSLVEVPRVIGMDINDAEMLLRGLGFDVQVFSFLGFGDTVSQQDPDPGQRVPFGSTIRLRTS